MGQDYEPSDGAWAFIFELLAMTAGAAVILLMLRWLGLAIPLLHQVGLV